MEINVLKMRAGIDRNKRLTDIYVQFEKLLSELRKRELPDEIVQSINTNIVLIETATESEEQWKKQLRKTQSDILSLIERELKLVPKNHYRNIWLALGIAAFGVPLGVVFGLSLGNMAFMGIGLPIGIPIGLAIGTGLDNRVGRGITPPPSHTTVHAFAHGGFF